MTDQPIDCYSTCGELFHECDGVEDALNNDEDASYVGTAMPVNLDGLAKGHGLLIVERIDEWLYDIVGEAADGNFCNDDADIAELEAAITPVIRKWLEGRVACHSVAHVRPITAEERAAWEAKDPWKRPLDAEGGEP